MVKGRDPVPWSSTDTPKALKESIVVFIGLLRAASSPSKVITPANRAAIGGTKRITVPANPQSILVFRALEPSMSVVGVTIT
jgi:hypothetical protein